MRDDGGGSSGSTQSQDYTKGYDSIKVDVHTLRDFYQKMALELFPTAMSSTSSVLAPMTQMIGSGLLGMGGNVDPQAGVFPEGVMVGQMMMDAHSKFAAFFKDVGDGIQCIGDAAGVIAEIYGNSDAENSASLNDVLFAFNDPNASRPKDLPKGAKTQTFGDQQAEMMAKSGQNAMALTQPESAATQVINPVSGVTIYFFSDGSSKQIVTNSDTNSWATGTTATTTYYFNGKQVGTTVQSQYKVRGGYSYNTTSTSPSGDPNAPGSTTTQVVTNPDGSQTITNTTIGADGKPKTGDPIKVAAPVDKPSTDQGPIQTAEQQYQTSGDKDYVQQHGAGY